MVVLPNEIRKRHQEFPIMLVAAQANLKHTPLVSYSDLFMPEIIIGAVHLHVTEFLWVFSHPEYKFLVLFLFALSMVQPA